MNKSSLEVITVILGIVLVSVGLPWTLYIFILLFYT